VFPNRGDTFAGLLGNLFVSKARIPQPDKFVNHINTKSFSSQNPRTICKQ